MHQVIMNLYISAQHAMGENGGELARAVRQILISNTMAMMGFLSHRKKRS
jgi:hypothetical protein